MTTISFRYTPEQQKVFEENERFIPAAFLDDGDLLVLEEAGPLGGPYEGSHIAMYLPKVLTRDGKVHGVSYHYERHHDLDVPPWDRLPPGPGPDLESPDQLLITLDAAAAYLASAHDIRVTTRTLRNWCRDGRIACRRISEKRLAPWFTTIRALDTIATEWVDGVHVRGPGSTGPDPEEATDELQ